MTGSQLDGTGWPTGFAEKKPSRGSDRPCPKRNGGRHCCQPPLRRAKDLPVFVTWSIEPYGLPTRSRSWLTSSGVASYRTAPSCEEPDLLLDCATRRSACLSMSGLSLENLISEPKS